MAGNTRGRAKVDNSKASARTLARRKADNKASRVTGDGTKPIKPRHLQGEAAKFWKAYVPVLIRNNSASVIDTPELTAMCEFWQGYRDCMGDKNIRLAMTYYREFSKVSARFGMTPADRQKLKEVTEDKTETALDQWFNRRNVSQG